jgi:hypothetical protein
VQTVVELAADTRFGQVVDGQYQPSGVLFSCDELPLAFVFHAQGGLRADGLFARISSEWFAKRPGTVEFGVLTRNGSFVNLAAFDFPDDIALPICGDGLESFDGLPCIDDVVVRSFASVPLDAPPEDVATTFRADIKSCNADQRLVYLNSIELFSAGC